MKKSTKISIVETIILSSVATIANVAIMALLLPKEPFIAWFFGIIIMAMIVSTGTMICFNKLEEDAKEAEKNKK